MSEVDPVAIHRDDARRRHPHPRHRLPAPPDRRRLPRRRPAVRCRPTSPSPSWRPAASMRSSPRPSATRWSPPSGGRGRRGGRCSTSSRASASRPPRPAPCSPPPSPTSTRRWPPAGWRCCSASRAPIPSRATPSEPPSWPTAGVRVVGLVHYVDNGLGTVQLPWNDVGARAPADPPHGSRPGLSAAGRRGRRRPRRRPASSSTSAHADRATTLAICERVGAAGRPVISSHSGATGRPRVRPLPRRRRAAGHRRHRRPRRALAVLLPGRGRHRPRRAGAATPTLPRRPPRRRAPRASAPT